MHKCEYLSKTRKFIRYVVSVATAASWPRRYFDKERNRPWECSSLLDAVRNYQYSISPDVWRNVIDHDSRPADDGLRSNSRVLVALSRMLRKAREEPDEESAQRACVQILEWGGVYSRGPRGQRNKDRLDKICSRPGGLIRYLNEVDASLASESDDFEEPCNREIDALSCNAGFTKIYSLMRDDFVIYDSRVAAALGLLVADYCKVQGHGSIPPELRFMWMPASATKDADGHYRPNQLRNPSVATLTFATRQPGKKGHSSYFRHNVRANWLLAAAAEEKEMHAWTAFAAQHQVTVLRALEAALFMVGYDLNPPLSGSVDSSVLSA